MLSIFHAGVSYYSLAGFEILETFRILKPIMQGLFNFQFFNQVRKYLNSILYYNIRGLMIYAFIGNPKKQKYRKCVRYEKLREIFDAKHCSNKFLFCF